MKRDFLLLCAALYVEKKGIDIDYAVALQRFREIPEYQKSGVHRNVILKKWLPDFLNNIDKWVDAFWKEASVKIPTATKIIQAPVEE